MRWYPAIRGQSIDRRGKYRAQSVQQFILWNSSFLEQLLDRVAAQSLLQVRGSQGRVWTGRDPGPGRLGISIGGELVHKIAEGSRYASVGSFGARKKPAESQTTENGAKATLRGGGGGIIARRTFASSASESAEKFSELVMVLECRRREQSEQRDHAR